LILLEGGSLSNYSAWSPALPGCVATDESLEDAEREMRAAIAFHLEGLAEDGRRISRAAVGVPLGLRSTV
jgi:predicted RNase H-like HicB family nuclease